MNPYSIAYALGYFYGRAHGTIPVLPEQDEYHAKNAGFNDGFAAGMRDWQDVDLPRAALDECIRPEESL